MKTFQVSVFDTHEEMSDRASKWLIKNIARALATQGHCVFVPSAGRTPRRVYELLQTKYRSLIDWTRVICVQMDEYADVSVTLPISFAYQLQKELIEPLGIPTFHTFFDEFGTLAAPLSTLDARIALLGGIDVVLYGIGENGHLGFNEPGSSESASTGYVQLCDTTLKVNRTGNTLADSQNLPARGITLGLSVLLQAKRALMIASGERKRHVVEAFVTNAVSPDNPATYLRRYQNVAVMLTADCAPFYVAGSHRSPQQDDTKAA